MPIAELRQVLREAKEKVKVEAMDAFKAEFKSAFESNPDVKAMRWNQYTPYFNDGDECVFGVNDLMVKAENPEDAEDADGFASLWGGNKNEPLLKWWNSIQCDEAFLAAFGNHCQITATPEGFEVDGYDHD
jgi:hypothetical protein